jgi:transposase
VYKKLNSTEALIQRTTHEGSSTDICITLGSTFTRRRSATALRMPAARSIDKERSGPRATELDLWMKYLPQPWTVAMEATIFTGWVYDHLLPHGAQVKVAHPLMLRAIAASKKKNDRIDAGKIADCLRCDFLPECHMASTEIRDRRRTLRYRHLLVRQMVQMKNRISGLLMETGVSHNKQRLHKESNREVDDSIRRLWKLSRETIVRLQKTEYALVSSLERDPLLRPRLNNLRTVPGVGPITALTWALEIGDVSRFSSIKQAISYCGLCGDEKSSAEKVLRTPISKKRNKHIQRVLIEAAKLGPKQSHELAQGL